MANDEHVAILKKGVDAWNAWRDENLDIDPDLDKADLRGAHLDRADLESAYLSKANLHGAHLSGATLSGAHLHGADLSEANLHGAHLDRAYLSEADLRGAILSVAHLRGAILSEANLHKTDLNGAFLSESDLRATNLSEANLHRAFLREADLRGADLRGANLSEADLNGAQLGLAYLSGAHLNGAHLRGADLSEANLSGADLCRCYVERAILVDTELSGADLTGCRIYGVSAWGLKLERAKQQNLIITREYEPEITVDNIEVAQFIYLMLHNQKVREVIDTITSKVVLILGRFTDERKAVLDALREELRKRDYLPILFDFNVPATRDITETVSLLARMARFVVADITDAKSVPQELAEIVPHLPSVPVQPLLLQGSAEYGMFEHFRRYPWVLETYTYPSSERLIADLGERVIGPAEDYARSIR